MIDRLPPQSLEAEQSVLGAILIDRDRGRHEVHPARVEKLSHPGFPRPLSVDADRRTEPVLRDDLLDLRIMVRAGAAVTVADAPEPVRRAAHYVTRRTGGRGAVRELVDLLLESAGRRDVAYRALGIELP